MTICRTAAAALVASMATLALLATAPAARAAVVEPALLTAAQAAPQVNFVLLLRDKADLAAATASARTKAEKGAATVAALKATAAASQAPVLAALAQRGLAHRAFWVANAITVRGTLADVQALAALPQVAELWHITTEANLLSPYIARRAASVAAASGKAAPPNFVAKALGDTAEPGLRQLRAPEVWQLGIRGQGVVVGDHDVGVMWDHPALKKQYRGWDEATQTASHAYHWRNAFGAADLFCTDPEVPCDSNGHGTHTTGTIVGFDGADNQIGMAPEAQWMACRSLLDPVLGVGTVPTYLDCMEWQIAPYPEGEPDAADPAMAPDVVSNSWGCLEACAPPLLRDVNESIKAAGIVQVVSAGNDGDTCSTIAFPLAVYESSFTVGANDVAGEMAGFSSRGPVLTDGSLRLKPNVTAPGVDTRSSLNDGGYGELSGTSMAGPHVVGLVALVMSAEPRLKGRVDDVRLLVERSAVQDITTVQTCGGTAVSDIPNNITGWGRVDALNAVTMRPQLVMQVDAPASAAVGQDYTVNVRISQPDTGKIDATNVRYAITLPANSTLVSCTSGCSMGPETGVTELGGSIAKLAPGESFTDTLVLRAANAGERVVSVTSEADQVSPVAAVAGKTAVGSVAGGLSDEGRFGGGALGAGWVLLAAALLRRRVLRR